MNSIDRYRGIKALVQDAVFHGSIAVERIQKETAQRPFSILEQIPTVAPFARGVHVVHDASVSGVHVSIRAVTRLVGFVADRVLDAVEANNPGESNGSVSKL